MASDTIPDTVDDAVDEYIKPTSPKSPVKPRQPSKPMTAPNSFRSGLHSPRASRGRMLSSHTPLSARSNRSVHQHMSTTMASDSNWSLWYEVSEPTPNLPHISPSKVPTNRELVKLNPGPGSYSPRNDAFATRGFGGRFESGPSYTFGVLPGSGREKGSAPATETPGPCHIIKSNLGKESPSYSLGTRRNMPKSFPTPGPGSYNLGPRDPGKSLAPRWKFGTSRRFLD